MKSEQLYTEAVSMLASIPGDQLTRDQANARAVVLADFLDYFGTDKALLPLADGRFVVATDGESIESERAMLQREVCTAIREYRRCDLSGAYVDWELGTNPLTAVLVYRALKLRHRITLLSLGPWWRRLINSVLRWDAAWRYSKITGHSVEDVA